MLKTTVKVFKEVHKVIPFYNILYFLTMIISVLAVTGNTYITAMIFDNVYTAISHSGSSDLLFRLIFLYLGMYLLNLIINLFANFISKNGFYQKGTNMFKLRLGEHASKLSLLDLEKPDVLNLLERSKRCVSGNKITNIAWNCRNMAEGTFTVIGISSVLAAFNIWLVPIAILSCIPNVAARIIRGEKFYELQKSQIPKVRTLDYLWSLFLSPAQIKEMRVLGFSDFLSGKWEKINLEVTEANWNFQKRDATILFLFDLFKILCYIAGILLSVFFVYKKMITIGQFGACLTAFLSLQNSIWWVFRQLSGFTGNCPFVEDYFKFLEIRPEAWGEKEFKGIEDKIEMKHVYFKYPNIDFNVLEDISLVIKKGEKVALVGENGSGKTTLSKILLGLYPFEKGSLQYNGIDLKKYEIRSFYNYLSTISQNFTKYFLNLRENVAISNVAQINDDEKIIKTLKETEIIETLEKIGGLDGMLGREFGGVELSGGQWQKLALSRGMFKDYDFIVLDEPTSALDPIVETEIFKKFLEIMDNKTSLIISHRVGLCRLVDKIIVLKNGKIIETGTHTELINRKGYYSKLFKSQQVWYI